MSSLRSGRSDVTTPNTPRVRGASASAPASQADEAHPGAPAPPSATPLEKKKGTLTWETALSSSLAVGTFLFGIFSWWDSKQQTSTADKPLPKIVVVTAPSNPPSAIASTARPTNQPGPVQPPADSQSLHVITLSNGNSLYYYRNLSLHLTHPKVERALVVVASSSGDHTQNLYRALVKMGRRAGRERDTLIVVPILPTSTENLRKGEPCWESGWEIGNLSGGTNGISSFQAIDELVGHVANPERFPHLGRIVVAGNGSGGTFVNRYVAGGRPTISEGGARGPIALEYVIMGAQTYLYLDDVRPTAGGRFATPKADECPGFNAYRYGLERLNPYLSQVSADSLRQAMTHRRAVYVIGTADTSTSERLDVSCAAMLQGRHRYQRALNYWHYIQRFPTWKAHVAFHPISGVGYFSLTTADSPELRALLFGAASRRKP